MQLVSNIMLAAPLITCGKVLKQSGQAIVTNSAPLVIVSVFSGELSRWARGASFRRCCLLWKSGHDSIARIKDGQRSITLFG